MAAKDTNEDRKTEDQDAEMGFDMSQAAVKKMIGEAREKGYITYDQLNPVSYTSPSPRDLSTSRMPSSA